MTAAVIEMANLPPRVLTRGPGPRRVDLWLYGCGNVGRELCAMLAAHRATICEREQIELRVVAITNTRGTRFDSAGLDPRNFAELSPEALSPADIVRRMSSHAHPMLVDLTATDAGALYIQAAEAGLAIATANKLPFVSAAEPYRRMQAAARRGRGVYYETTVGADLPVLGPLADRVRSGDRILRVEGSLSGTLGLLSDAVSRGVPLDKAVLDAQAQGTTEPDPCEDLSGNDVARKALIITRELGLSLELEDVELEGFVSLEVLRDAREGGLYQALAKEAPRLSARVRGLAKAGSVLRYLATIDPGAARPVRIGLTAVAADHPAASLRGTEAMVTITTERTAGYPLTIRGPGAGGAVTASGVLADIVRGARS